MSGFALLLQRGLHALQSTGFCVLEPGLMRGGDGGSTLHGGAGIFAEWLTLASAFSRRWDREIYNGAGAHLRRVFSIV